jgi:hypothetical protein
LVSERRAGERTLRERAGNGLTRGVVSVSEGRSDAHAMLSVRGWAAGGGPYGAGRAGRN